MDSEFSKPHSTMSLPMQLALAAALLATVAGCGPSFQDLFLAVEPGTDRGAVLAALGEPDHAGWFLFTHTMMGPPEVLQGVVPDSTEVEGLMWTRPSSTSPDSVIFELYFSREQRVLATTHHGVGTVF